MPSVPKVDATYVADTVNDCARPLWRAPRSRTRPVICFDESPTQLIGEVRAPIPAEATARLERFDFEYKRNGTVNLFIFVRRQSPLAQGQGHRATCRRRLLPMHARDSATSISPKPKRSWVVMDNLSTHRTRPPSTTPCPHPRPGASSAAWSSTSPPSTPAGSTWWRSRDRRPARPMPRPKDRPVATSCEAEIAAWDFDSATTAPRASNGCSRRRKPDTN